MKIYIGLDGDEASLVVEGLKAFGALADEFTGTQEESVRLSAECVRADALASRIEDLLKSKG